MVISITFAQSLLSKGTVQQNLEEKKIVVVTNGIIADVVYNVARERVVIKCLISGQDIHDWEPSAKDIAEVAKASIVIYSTKYLETWIDKLRTAIPETVEFVEAAEQVEFLSIDGAVDPHFWFDVRNMVKVTEKITEELSKIDPDNSEYYSMNAEIYKKKLIDLHENYLSKLANFKGRVIVTRHDAYRYLGNAYGLVTVSILGVHEEEITPAKMQYLLELIKNGEVKVIFTEYEQSDDFVSKFATEHGLRTVKLYSLESITLEDVLRGEGYIYMMSKNLEALLEGLSLE